MAYLSKLLSFFGVMFLLFPLTCSAQTLPQTPKPLRAIDSIMNRRPQNRLRGFPKNEYPFSPNEIPNSSIKTRQRKISNNYPKVLTTDRQQNINPQCQDTSLRLVFEKGSWMFANDYITKTKDGNVLIPGFDNSNSPPDIINAHLIKCTQQGDTLWSRSIQGVYSNYSMDVYLSFELNDGTILLVGDMDVPMPINGRSDFMMLRVSSTGSLIWEKTFKTKLWDADTTEGSIDIYDCKQDVNGNMYLAGDVRHGGFPRATLGFKMDISGNILWSKSFVIGSFPSFVGVDINGSRVTFVGKLLSDYNTINGLGVVMDATTGDTLFSKTLLSTDADAWHSFYENNMVKLSNGNLALFGPGGTDGAVTSPPQMLTHAGILEITPDLDFVSSHLFRSMTPENTANTRITVFEDGSAAYTMLNYISGYNGDAIYGNYKNGQILKERVIPYRGIGVSWVSNFLQLDDGGQLVTNFFGDSATSVSAIEFMRLHNSDTSGSCVGKDTVSNSVENETFYNGVPYFDSINVNVLTEDPRPFKGIFNDDFTISSNCKQVSFCDSLKISVPHDTICANTALTISVKKNKECGAIPAWDYDTSAVQFFNMINDSSFSISFHKPWQGYIYSTINGCNTLEDSVKLTVLQSPVQLNLGPDTVICPGNTILLNAKSGYASYQWQDGSTDSVFTVTQPGLYHVQVSDACSRTFSDTVIVSPHPPIPLDAGPDRIKCNNDTIQLHATPGFLNYEWLPDYQLNSTTSPDVIANPLTDTSYTVKAEKTPGCFAYDTVHLKVNQSMPINLGADTSFCFGDSAIFNAGNYFSSYTWSNGSNASFIIVKAAGMYFVNATSAGGCHSYDTVQVIKVFSNPVVTLDHNNNLCTGDTRLLDGGNFISYLWNDGSIGKTLLINKKGTYYVSVTDENNCKGSDTTFITNILPLPSGFLPNDTTICSYEKLVINASPGFANYLWSDNETTSSITVDKAGVYSLEVTDDNDCVGKDSVTVSLKDCMQGFYIPNAFTPNNDGLNDVFKPMIFGNVIHYSFEVYNRFGQKVFESTDLSKGWDGRFHNIDSPADIFVWTCSFQLAGGNVENEKGTVMLMR